MATDQDPGVPVPGARVSVELEHAIALLPSADPDQVQVRRGEARYICKSNVELGGHAKLAFRLRLQRRGPPCRKEVKRRSVRSTSRDRQPFAKSPQGPRPRSGRTVSGTKSSSRYVRGRWGDDAA